jgi:hypothetical protein
VQLLEVLVDMDRFVRALTGSTNQKGALDGRLDVDQLADETSE